MEKTASTSRLRRHLTQVGGCILLLLAFLAIFLFLFFQFRTAALQSITSANESFGNYVDSVLDLSHANIRTSAMQVFYTSSIRTLRTKKDMTRSEQIIGLRDLGNFVSSSNFIDNIMVYNGELDMVFTSESGHGSAPSGQFHDQEAVRLLLHSENHSYLTPFKRQAGGYTHYSFLFPPYESSEEGAMLLDINAAWYEAQLLGSLSKERHMIVDSQGRSVIRASEEGMELPAWEVFESAFSSAPNSGYVLLDNSPFLSSCWVYHKLGQTGWFYLEYFQLKIDAPGLYRVQRVVFAVFALICVAILILFAYLLFVILPTFLHISRALTSVSSEGRDFTEKFDRLLSSYGYVRDGHFYRMPQAKERFIPRTYSPANPNALDAIPDSSKEPVIVIFCHLGITCLVLSYLLNIAFPALVHGFFLPTSSITVLSSEERWSNEAYFRVQTIGDVQHLLANHEPVSSAGSFTTAFQG